MSLNTYVGPAEVKCPLRCWIPEGCTATEVPRPRHDWADVIVCPNHIGRDGRCPVALLVRDTPA